MAGGRIEDVLVIKDDASPAFKKAAEAALEAQKAYDAAREATEKAAAADRDAAKAAEDAAQALAEKAAAAAREQRALEGLDEETRQLIASYKAAKKAAEDEADALGLTTSELARLKAARKAATEETEKAAKASDDVADATDDMGDSIGQAGENAAKLRGMLGLLSPALGEAAGFANDLFDTLEVGAGASSALIGPLAAVGVAVGVATVAYTALDAAMQKANERNAEVLRSLDAVKPLYDQVWQAKIDQKVATNELTEAEAQAIATQREWNTTTAETIALLRQQQAELIEKTKPGVLDTALSYWGLKESVDSVAYAVNDAVGWAAPLAALWVESAETSKKAAQEVKNLGFQMDAAAKAGEKGKAAALGTADATNKSSEAATKLAAATDKAREAEEKAAAVMREWTAIMDAEFVPVANAAADALAGIYAVAESLDPRALSDAERLALAEADLALALSRGTISGDAATAAAERLAQARAALAANTAELADEEARKAAAEAKAASDSKIRTTADAITGGPQAGMNALATQAGPWGYLIAGILEMVSNMADTLASFQDYHNNLKDAIATLPETLADNMGSIFSDSFATIIPDFVSSFADNLGEIIGGLLSGLASTLVRATLAMIVELPLALTSALLDIFSVDFWKGVGESIAEAFKEAFAGIFDGVKTLGGKISDRADAARERSREDRASADRSFAAVSGSYDTGGYIPRTGLYLMHAGERVAPSTGAGSFTTEAGLGHPRLGGRSGGSGGAARMVGSGGRLLLEIDTESVARAMRSEAGRGIRFGGS